MRVLTASIKSNISYRLLISLRRRRPGNLIISYFSDIVIRHLADDHDNLPDDAHLFIEVVADGNKAQKMELWAQESAMLSWGLNEVIEL